MRSPIIERSTKYLYDEEAVITVGDGVGTGKVFHYVNGKYDLHQRCYRMYGFSDELNAHYFYHTFSKLFYKRVMAMTAKTSVDSVRLEMISDMKIPVSNVEEQRKIGNLLDGIDHLITLHQRKPIPHPNHPIIHTKHKGEEKYVRIRVNDRGKIDRTANLRRFPVDIPRRFKDGGGSVGEFQIYSGAE